MLSVWWEFYYWMSWKRFVLRFVEKRECVILAPSLLLRRACSQSSVCYTTAGPPTSIPICLVHRIPSDPLQFVSRPTRYPDVCPTPCPKSGTWAVLSDAAGPAVAELGCGAGWITSYHLSIRQSSSVRGITRPFTQQPSLSS